MGLITLLSSWSEAIHASPAVPRFELSGKEMVGHGQLADLRVQLLHLLLVDLRGLLTAALEHARGAFQQSLRPYVDHRRVNSESARQFGYRLLALQRLKSSLRTEIRRMLLPSRNL